LAFLKFFTSSKGLFEKDAAKFMQSIKIQTSDDHFSIGLAVKRHRPAPATDIPIDEFFGELDDYF
jgi:hypothetical protein